jgi:DNA-binding transcriptional LysR family regulator
MTLQQIQICDRLAALGSFNAAARSLGVTQPAISSALSILEDELGVQLFLRSRTGAELTRKGKELLPLMRAMVGLSNEIIGLTTSMPTDEGSLRIAGRQGFVQFVFPALFASLIAKYPKIHVESVLSGEQEGIVEALQTGRVDLAFAADPGIKSIIAETIFRDPVYLCRPKRHRSSGSKSAHLYCLPTRADRLRKPLEKLLRILDKNAVIAFESDDYTLLGQLVASGVFHGPVYGHMLLAPSIRSSVTPMGASGTQIYRDLTVLYRRDDLLPHVRTVKEELSTQTLKLLESVIKS